MQPPATSPATTAARTRSALLFVVALALALWHAAALTWLCDDAYISFRYARNLVEGHGLVFNVGEAVEGYTNFSWTLLLAGGMALGLEPEALAPLLGLASFAGTAGLLFLASLRLRSARGGTWLPVAALGWLALSHARIFATSGLETPAVALALVLGALLAVDARTPRDHALLGLVGALATLTRPEGALVVALGGGLALLSRSGRALGAWAVAAGLVLGPWIAWKLSFYGDLLPNTWYAKAGEGARWSEGLVYVGLFFRSWPVVPLGLLVAAGLALARLRQPEPLRPGWDSARAPLVLLALALPYLLHVVRVGGDFMYARFCLPWTPLLLLGLELGLRELRPRLGLALGGGAVVTILLAPFPPELENTHEEPWRGIVEERWWYDAHWREEARRQGAVIREATEGLPVRGVYLGTQAMLVYYAELPVAVEGHVGLTDHELARMPAPEGATVGHGRKATWEYLRQREIDLAFSFRLPHPTTRFTEVDFGEGVKARLIVYRPEVVEGLRARGVQIFDLPAFLDAYIDNMHTFDDEKVARDHEAFEDFYFGPSGDTEREAAFLARLSGSGETP